MKITKEVSPARRARRRRFNRHDVTSSFRAPLLNWLRSKNEKHENERKRERKEGKERDRKERKKERGARVFSK